MHLKYLPKSQGGRLQNVATFCHLCDNIKDKDASFIINNTIQSANDAADIFAHVGTTKLENTNFIVKIMLYGKMALQEEKVAKIFRENPHRNIVQNICSFECNDNPIKWERRIKKPTPLCDINESTKMIVIIQEYINDGDLHKFKNNLTIEIWSSIIKQLTYACIEWYEYYGFLYGDWHYGNILIDKCETKYNKYKVFGQEWKVKTYGYSPVLTDFSRSEIRPVKTLEPWQLASQISLIWDMLQYICPNETIQKQVQKYSIIIGECEDINEILIKIKECFKF